MTRKPAPNGHLRDRIVSFERVKASELVPDERNWRSHPKAQRDALQEVLTKVGFAGAILARRQGDKLIVIDGHLRQDLGADQEVPVLITDLTAKEAGHLLTVYDPIGAMAEANREKLAELLAKADIATKELLGQLQRTAGKHLVQFMAQNDPEAVPDPPKAPITKPGDLWLLGEHRLLCGDATDKADVERLMGDERAGLMVADPPYGIGYDNNELHPRNTPKQQLANDDQRDAQLQEFLESAFHPAKDLALIENAAWYLWHAMLTQGYFAAAAAAAADVVLHRQIIWVKQQLIFGRGQYHWKHELCFMGWRKGNPPPDYSERNQTTVWEIDSIPNGERKEFNHATPKPVELFRIPMLKHLQPGEVCYEPFAGTGPQYIAAEELGRKCYGLEIEPAYCDVVVARWELFTGNKAKLA